MNNRVDKPRADESLALFDTKAKADAYADHPHDRGKPVVCLVSSFRGFSMKQRQDYADRGIVWVVECPR